MENRFNSDRQWKCTYCDTVNDVERDLCYVCEAVNANLDNVIINDYHEHLKDKKHDLPKFQKPTISPLTEENHFFPPIEKSIFGTKLDGWKCVHCTMLNNSNVRNCRACDNPNRDFGKWKCTQCTLLNEKDSENCNACFTLNPFIRPCPQCGINTINEKYNEKCEKCKTKMELVRPDYARNNQEVGRERNDSWSCSKCSLQNSSDSEVCAACNNPGPNNYTWKCEKCTFVNDNLIDNCAICGILKSKTKKRYNVMMALFEVDGDELLNVAPKLNTISFPKPKYDVTVCRRCLKQLQLDEDQLCQDCKKEYYICEKIQCGMLMEIGKLNCTKCGFEKYDQVQLKQIPRRGWECSWKKCQHLNEENFDLCQNCCCYRDLNENKSKCISCGWIKIKSTNCLKCGYP